MRDNRKSNNSNSINSIIYKLLLLNNRNLAFPKYSISVYICFYIFAYFFIVFVDIDSKYGKHNIIDTGWADKFNGTEKADTIIGTLKGDTIRGFNDNDVLTGKEAGDDISGGSGDDVIYGNEGKDILKGKAGHDLVQGGEGNDKIYGDRGNDILVGAEGNDILTGGYGTDIFICGIELDTITDFNITQKDITPYNDCENIKSIVGVQSEKYLFQL